MHFTVAILAMLVVGVVSQDAVPSEQDLVCQGVRDTFYATDLERESDPCSYSCTYDSASRRLEVTCRYDHCKECDSSADICGIRVVKMDHVLSEVTLATVFEQPGQPLEDLLGEDKEYCIDYQDDGKFAGKLICIQISNTFNTDCDSQFSDLDYGLPLLTCDDSAAGCRCKTAASPQITTSLMGFSTLSFDTCYDENATAPTTLSGSRSLTEINFVWLLSMLAMSWYSLHA